MAEKERQFCAILCFFASITVVQLAIIPVDKISNNTEPLLHYVCDNCDAANCTGDKCLCRPGYDLIADGICRLCNTCIEITCTDADPDQCHCPTGYGLLTDGICKKCDCGDERINCTYVDEEKTCSCPIGFQYFEDTCTMCSTCKLALCSDDPRDHCRCPAGYALQSKWLCKECDCGNANMTCTFQGDSKICKCPYGFRAAGNLCHDVCDRNPCLEGGYCVRMEDTALSNCTERFTGDYCQIDVCNPGTCSFAGYCSKEKGRYKCRCKGTNVGEFCEKDLCNPNPCQNRGLCSKEGEYFKCTCNETFIGASCEIDVCEKNKCLHGECERFDLGYRCRCHQEFTGIFCYERIDGKTGISTISVIGAIICSSILSGLIVGLCIFIQIRWCSRKK